MSTAAAARTRITPEEYLARERRAETKSEYLDGQIYAMAGASLAHNMITSNVVRELGAQLRDGPCFATSSDLRVSPNVARHYTYPDVVVVCGEPRLLDGEFDTLLNPTVVVEVLSPSTEAYDRGLKAEHYRRLESLREYVLVAQDRVHVERYSRRGDDWVLTEFSEAGATLTLESIGCAVALAEIYAKVPVEPAADEAR